MWRHFPRSIRVFLDTKYVFQPFWDFQTGVLRNQLVHGGATWNSGTNRSQVADGARIMDVLAPIVIHLLMREPGRALEGSLLSGDRGIAQPVAANLHY